MFTTCLPWSGRLTTANRDIEGLGGYWSYQRIWTGLGCGRFTICTGLPRNSVSVHMRMRSMRFWCWTTFDFHASFLEGVQVFSQSADRLLQAAIVLGPSGRSVNDLSADVRSDYNSLVSEGGFFFAVTPKFCLRVLLRTLQVADSGITLAVVWFPSIGVEVFQ